MQFKLDDKMTHYVKEKSGLTKLDFIGLIICFPLHNCVIAFSTWFLGRKLDERTLKGIKLVEICAESITQFVFTCYITAYHGLGDEFDGLIQLFSIFVSFFSTIYGFTDIWATDLYSEPINCTYVKDFIKTLAFSLVEITLNLSMTIVFTIIYGVWILFGTLGFIWSMISFLQCLFFQRKGKIADVGNHMSLKQKI